MERMVGPRRPFYKAGPVIRLNKIPADEFAAFIDVRFRRSGIRPEPGLAGSGNGLRENALLLRTGLVATFFSPQGDCSPFLEGELLVYQRLLPIAP